MSTNQPYVEKKFNLSGLNGISDRTLEIHFGLYAGYVKNTNILNEQISELIKNGKAGSVEYAELKRRLGFEYNGMILHEYYFGNLTSSAAGLDLESKLSTTLVEAYGSFEKWKDDFVKVGSLRGVGWAILFQDPATGNFSNQWITLHQDGIPAGFKPVLVLDVWEHAFLLDYKPAERGKYIEAFFSNIDWKTVENRVIA